MSIIRTLFEILRHKIMHRHFGIGTFMESGGHPCLKELESQAFTFVDGSTIPLMDF